MAYFAWGVGVGLMVALAIGAWARSSSRTTRIARRAPDFEMLAADWVAQSVGSWKFVALQSSVLVVWIFVNATGLASFDPYPFILLNLALSFQAAYTAPMIMMSQNRQAEIDRRRSIDDFDINQKAELEIRTLHTKVDLLRETEIAALAASVERLTRLLDDRRS